MPDDPRRDEDAESQEWARNRPPDEPEVPASVTFMEMMRHAAARNAPQQPPPDPAPQSPPTGNQPVEASADAPATRQHAPAPRHRVSRPPFRFGACAASSGAREPPSA